MAENATVEMAMVAKAGIAGDHRVLEAKLDRIDPKLVGELVDREDPVGGHARDPREHRDGDADHAEAHSARFKATPQIVLRMFFMASRGSRGNRCLINPVRGHGGKTLGRRRERLQAVPLPWLPRMKAAALDRRLCDPGFRAGVPTAA